MNRIALILLASLTLTYISCVREDTPAGIGVEPGNKATIALDLTVDVCETRSTENTQIRNLCILQFNGTDENAKIVGEAKYISDDADPSDEERYLDFNKIRLADSQGEVHTLVILANTFKKLPQVSTLGEMKGLIRMIEEESDLFAYDGEDPDLESDQKYIRFNAMAVTAVKNGTIVKGTLRRSMARINLRIENNDQTNGLVISGIQLCNVSQHDHYLTDYRYISPSDNTENNLFSEEFQDYFNPLIPNRIDYPIVEWKGNSDGTGISDHIFYLTCNQRGICEDTVHPFNKNNCPNAEGATYIRIHGFYGDSHDIPVEYRYYLGEDDYKDFNIKPNSINDVRIVFDNAGDPEVDDRITVTDKDFDVNANCYILNPHPNYSRSYTFNVVQRINDFWGKRFGLNSDLVLENSEQWHARILWSDTMFTPEQINGILARSSGNNSGNYMSDSQRVKITLPAGMTHCNIIIGVYSDDPETILWSWHLWITDYEPDNIIGHAPENDRYLYAVQGGEVHRYVGPAWEEGGKYKDGYVMDRSLGCFDTQYNPGNKGQGLYYQFGRKDPFPGNYKGYKYDTYNKATIVGSTAYVDITSDALAPYGGANVPYSVNNPMVYISGSSSWTNNDVFTSDRINHWNDPYTFKNSGNDEIGGTSDKSFFDPCPPGWELPSGSPVASEYWVEDFLLNSSGTDPDANCIFQSHYLVYYPKGHLLGMDDPNAQKIYFPLQGYLTNEGGITWGHLIFYLATDLNSNGDTSYISFMATPNGRHRIFPRQAYSGIGITVRCIREDY